MTEQSLLHDFLDRRHRPILVVWVEFPKLLYLPQRIIDGLLCLAAGSPWHEADPAKQGATSGKILTKQSLTSLHLCQRMQL